MKNTIIMQLGENICPHYCIYCAKAGGLLCDCCKKYIIKDRREKCLVCGSLLVNDRCEKCTLPFLKQFWVGDRKGMIKNLINIYKYDSVRAASASLAGLLASVGDFREMVIVPLPTISRHIRERGFDHIGLLAKRLAAISGAIVCPALYRTNSCVQVGANIEQRAMQAKTAYVVKRNLDVNLEYLLLDDV